MRKREPIGRGLVDQSREGRVLQRPQHRLAVEIDHLLEHPDVELGSDHRGQGERVLRVFGQPCEPAQDHVAGRGRDAKVVRPLRGGRSAVLGSRNGTGLHEAADDLVDEEGIAVGLVVQRARELTSRIAEVVPRGRFDDRLDGLGVESADRDEL